MFLGIDIGNAEVKTAGLGASLAMPRFTPA